jgi:hypothetical protein
MTLATNTETTAGKPAHLWDDRGFYRKALAVVAPLPMLAMGVNYILVEMPGDGPFKDMVAAASRQEHLLVDMNWLILVFFAFLIPAVIAVAVVTRRRAPRLTVAGLVLTVPGFALGFGAGPDDTQLALLTHQKHLDLSTMTALDTALWGTPSAGLSSLLFIVGITIGLLLLGIALTRARGIPAWYGVALAFGGFTHPFMPTHTLAGVGLIIAAVGFFGASLGLLRMSNDALAIRAGN